jgi:hypothetical protein
VINELDAEYDGTDIEPDSNRIIVDYEEELEKIHEPQFKTKKSSKTSLNNPNDDYYPIKKPTKV